VCCWSVGLAQREIEAAGFTTLTLTSIPDLTGAVSVPRMAAIEYPLGRPFGQPGDHAGQMRVLRATFEALENIDQPGGCVHLPFEWPEPPDKVQSHLPAPPPIVGYLKTHPWDLPRLLRRNAPGHQD
jgi:hypothetical protein